MITTWIITALVICVSIYIAYQKGRKVGRKEATWLQKMSIHLMQALSGYPRPHLTVILITEDNGIGKGNKHEYPECPEGFSLCVLLDDMLAEPATREEALDNILKARTQVEYLQKACHDFEESERVSIKDEQIDREEILKTPKGEVKIIKKLVFLKVDTKN